MPAETNEPHATFHNARDDNKVAVEATGPLAAPTAPPARRYLSLLSSEERKKYPMGAGLMDYFPDALAGVANVSWRGNQKHNPGQELHWSRGKSMDHADCILRHHAERGTLDNEGVRHSLLMAWRALALAQEEMEKAYALDPPRGAKDATTK